MDVNDYLTVREAATRLRVTPETVRRMVRAGRLRASLTTIQAGYRIPSREVERILAPSDWTSGAPESALTGLIGSRNS